MHTKPLHRLLALLLALLMMIGGASAFAVEAGETISKDSKWINSDIEGAVDENTQVSIKDDFHTAVNLEWLLNDEEGMGAFEKSEELLYERKLEIVLGEAEIDPANADAVGLSSEWLQHDLKLVQTFSSLSGEWEYRNAYGAEPARPFLEAIASIETMEDMTAYLCNADGMNFTGFSLLSLGVEPDPETESVYMVAVRPNGAFTLQSQDEYSYISASGYACRFQTDASAQYLMQRMGYSEAEIRTMLKKCYRFEGRLADQMKALNSQQTADYADSAECLTLEELSALTGSYPVAQELEALDVEAQEQYLVYEKQYLKSLGKLYQPRYLEEIKAMCMVHTVCELLPLLDEEAYDKADEIARSVQGVPAADDEPVGQNDQDPATRRKDAAEFVFNNYLQTYLPGPMDQIYVAVHCTPELKNEVRAMIDEIIAYYGSMIQDVTWLSENARNATVGKLENIIIRCVYPDQFVDYTGLTFEGCRNGQGGTLPQAVAAINQFHTRRQLAKAGKSVVRGEWDMSEPYKSTTVCNAYYMPTENSINILAGILTEEMYTRDMPIEKKLAGVGSIIGHEITHAFDTTGYQYDKDGHLNPWWSTEDVEAFDLRASSLIKYYNNLIPYPGALLYSGSQVSGEAIADMGGVKCMLNIAQKDPAFDYEAFFRAYAQVWRTRRDLETEKGLATMDEHPLAFLRTNVTLMQFDKFHETFGIQPGDGMYMAPDKRISVW